MSPNPPLPSTIYHYLHYLPHQAVHSFTSSSLTFFFLFQKSFNRKYRVAKSALPFPKPKYGGQNSSKCYFKRNAIWELAFCDGNNSLFKFINFITKFQFFRGFHSQIKPTDLKKRNMRHNEKCNQIVLVKNVPQKLKCSPSTASVLADFCDSENIMIVYAF